MNWLYRHVVKRLLDIILSLLAIVILSPVFLVLAVLVRVKLGSPVIFKQRRPGRKDNTGQEQVFTLCKFRSMTDKRDSSGVLLPDSERMTRFGRVLRSTSLDELPELWNILKGDMSIIGPRPQLEKDLVFMSDDIRHRHDVRPGLTGLAQAKGRNGIDWAERFEFDLEYVKHVSFLMDLKVILLTVTSVIKKEGISEDGKATSTDYGDWLLQNDMITPEEFKNRMGMLDK